VGESVFSSVLPDQVFDWADTNQFAGGFDWGQCVGFYLVYIQRKAVVENSEGYSKALDLGWLRFDDHNFSGCGSSTDECGFCSCVAISVFCNSSIISFCGNVPDR
jgi:hypothetical protein